MVAGLRAVVAWTMYPALIGLALIATWCGLQSQLPPALVALTVVFVSTFPLLVAQRLLPAERTWAARPHQFSVDLLHLVSTAVATDGLRALVLGATLFAAVSVHDHVTLDPTTTVWPIAWALPAQLAFAILIGDFGAYWVHRLCHVSPLLWRVHAMHHSSDRMYVLAAARNHPFNAALMHAAHLVPLALMGAPVEILTLSTVFTGVNGMVQHANVDLRFGWANFVFATADLHRWHHSADRSQSNRNFGNDLIVWDAIFGTRYLEPGHPEEIGLGAFSLRENYLVHLTSPLVWYRLLRDGTRTPAVTAAPDTTQQTSG